MVRGTRPLVIMPAARRPSRWHELGADVEIGWGLAIRTRARKGAPNGMHSVSSYRRLHH